MEHSHSEWRENEGKEKIATRGITQRNLQRYTFQPLDLIYVNTSMFPSTTAAILLAQLLPLRLLNFVLPLLFTVRKRSFQVPLVPPPFAEGGVVLVLISTWGGLGSQWGG